MLDHVEQQHVVEVGEVDRECVSLTEAPAHERAHVAHRRLAVVDTDDVTALRDELACDPAGATAEIEHARTGRHRVDRERVRGRVAELRRVGGTGRRHVVLPPVLDADRVEQRRDRRPERVGHVGDASSRRDLVAVVGRDRHLGDPMSTPRQLDQDLRVEVQIVGVELEWNRAQRTRRVRAVAAVDVAEPPSEQPRLDRREHPVRESTQPRHSAVGRTRCLEETRADHGIRLTRQDRRDHVRKALRRVLAVAVQQHDGLVAVLDRELERELQVAAVALRPRILQHAHAARAPARRPVETGLEGAVG